MGRDSAKDGEVRAHGRAVPEPSPADLEAPPDHPAHVPAGDPGKAWRRKRRWLHAPGPMAPNGPDVLRRKTPAQMLDVHFAAAEWLRLAPCPEVAAYALRMIDAGGAILRCETDKERRAVSIGKILGLQVEGRGGLSAGRAIARDQRNALIRAARASRLEWRDASDRGAAALMLKEFRRYRDGAWQADQTRPTAPAGDPARAIFWRVLRLGVPVPDTPEGLALILMSE